MAEKRDVRLQVFVTSEMDDKLSDICDLMGMTKNEMVRFAIGSYVGSWNKSMELVRENFDKHEKD